MHTCLSHSLLANGNTTHNCHHRSVVVLTSSSSSSSWMLFHDFQLTSLTLFRIKDLHSCAPPFLVVLKLYRISANILTTTYNFTTSAHYFLLCPFYIMVKYKSSCLPLLTDYDLRYTAFQCQPSMGP